MSRAAYIPVERINNTNVPGSMLWTPDYLSSTYLSKIKILPIDRTYILTGDDIPYPELLAYKIYGDVNLWWVLCMVNGIVDPMTDMKAGTVWNIPSLTAIQSMLAEDASTSDSQIGSVVEL